MWSWTSIVPQTTAVARSPKPLALIDLLGFPSQLCIQLVKRTSVVHWIPPVVAFPPHLCIQLVKRTSVVHWIPPVAAPPQPKLWILDSSLVALDFGSPQPKFWMMDSSLVALDLGYLRFQKSNSKRRFRRNKTNHQIFRHTPFQPCSQPSFRSHRGATCVVHFLLCVDSFSFDTACPPDLRFVSFPKFLLVFCNPNRRNSNNPHRHTQHHLTTSGSEALHTEDSQSTIGWEQNT